MTDTFLERIAIALERLVSLTELGSGEPRCEHPDDARVDASAMGWERWSCRLCGYHVERQTGLATADVLARLKARVSH